MKITKVWSHTPSHHSLHRLRDEGNGVVVREDVPNPIARQDQERAVRTNAAGAENRHSEGGPTEKKWIDGTTGPRKGQQNKTAQVSYGITQREG